MTSKGSTSSITHVNASAHHANGNVVIKPSNDSFQVVASPKTIDPPKSSKYCHVTAVHSIVRSSCLSHDSETTPSFLGFRNLMVIVLIVMNLRLMVENFMKYGVLICIRCHDYRRQDLILGIILYALVPCHLFVAYVIERAAAQEAKGVIGLTKRENAEFEERSEPSASKAFQSIWWNVAWAHAINASLCILVTTGTIYWYIHHPMVGTISEIHAIVVCLKICSYALTNRDLRNTRLSPGLEASLPPIYSECPYPRNITVSNLSYFWWAPTLVYQPVYPRSENIRWLFFAKRLTEVASLSIFVWLASAQYAAPVLRNSLSKMASRDFASILERLMKLSTISLVIWLAGFFAVFQSTLNALAEITRFGDRNFYGDWWNSPSVGTYWKTWNLPMYNFMVRHIYSPLKRRGWSHEGASMVVFTFSGLLHEIAVGIPTHNILGVAFFGMLVQLPLVYATRKLGQKHSSRIIGNCIFWVSFCLVGQPLAALLYFSAWQAKYGSVSKQK